MRFSIDLTEACPLLSSFARRETRELENSSASFSIVRVKTAPAISSADHPTDSPPSSESSVPLSAWTSPLSSPPLLALVTVETRLQVCDRLPRRIYRLAQVGRSGNGNTKEREKKGNLITPSSKGIETENDLVLRSLLFVSQSLQESSDEEYTARFHRRIPSF